MIVVSGEVTSPHMRVATKGVASPRARATSKEKRLALVQVYRRRRATLQMVKGDDQSSFKGRKWREATQCTVKEGN